MRYRTSEEDGAYAFDLSIEGKSVVIEANPEVFKTELFAELERWMMINGFKHDDWYFSERGVEDKRGFCSIEPRNVEEILDITGKVLEGLRCNKITWVQRSLFDETPNQEVKK